MSMTPEQIKSDLLRRAMPMTAYWRVAQATKQMIAIITLPLAISAAMLEATANTLQKQVFYKEDSWA